MVDSSTQLQIEESSPCLVVSGEIDAYTAPLLDAAIERRRATGATTVRLCLRGVSFIDSSGLRVIIASTVSAREAGGDLVLEAPAPAVTRLIEITGLAGELTVEPGPAEHVGA